MDCQKAQSKLHAYITETLDTDETEEFLKHVEKCPSCYDELEINYIVYYAVKRLDEEEEGSFNMDALLKNDIQKKKKHIRHYKELIWTLVILDLAALSMVTIEFLKLMGILFMQ